ncbi:phage shock protein PspA [Alteromonas pelagimontana]|uniref:Phage shock protein PspA n=1 Tax=Alteromonas pelagimontana TaxID=1858656 RepID=A0A6M4MG41_9ALTE|nr:phage shock protein PspA [Alteromonas pelagimontana]QJR81610.1 phage shock protein PspA [Alteromonas pelagimontana]
MSMFSRITDIVQANINALLDKAEDPEKVIRLIVQEMEETLIELRSVAAKNIAEQKYIDRQLSGYTKQATQWQENAELAMGKGKESLARAALVEKQKYLKKAEELNEQKGSIAEIIEKIQEDTGRLNAKLSEARAKQKALVSRHQSIGVRLKVKNIEYSGKVEDAMTRFQHYEQRIDHLEAQVDAYDLVSDRNHEASSLKAQFSDLQANDAIEQELAALKKNRAA